MRRKELAKEEKKIENTNIIQELKDEEEEDILYREFEKKLYP